MSRPHTLVLIPANQEFARNPIPKSLRYHRPIVLFARLCCYSFNTSDPSYDRLRGEVMTSERIRVMMVDDHPLLSEGLATVIKNQHDMLPVGQASSGSEALERFNQCRPDVTLMDLRLPDMSGIDAMIAIRSKFLKARFIILTTFAGDAEIQHALEA